MDSFKVQTTVEFSAEDVRDMIETADVEYWISAWEWREDGSFKLTVSGDGEDDDNYGDEYPISLLEIQAGLQAMAHGAPEHFANLVSEQYDSETCDVLVQFCCFGEIIYG